MFARVSEISELNCYNRYFWQENTRIPCSYRCGLAAKISGVRGHHDLQCRETRHLFVIDHDNFTVDQAIGQVPGGGRHSRDPLRTIHAAEGSDRDVALAHFEQGVFDTVIRRKWVRPSR